MSYLARLYTGSDDVKKAESYLEEHELELLMASDDRVSMLLSSIALSSGDHDISDVDIAELEAKGLIRKSPAGTSVSKRGMRIVSDYPLFGEYQKSRKYIDAFFPVLFSSIISRELSSRPTHWTRYFASDFFTSLFPSRDKEETARAAVHSVRSLLLLGVLRDNLGRMTVRKESCLSFMNLKDEDKLSWILFPTETDSVREKASKAISLLFRLRGIKQEELDHYLNTIERITGFYFDNADIFFDFGVLYSEDGIINGYERDDRKTDDGIISSDFILSYSGCSDKPIYLLCQPEKADVTLQWAITRKSLRSAFSMGYTPEEIISILSEVSKEELPPTLISRIDSWYRSFSSLTAERGVILTAESRNAKILESLPLLKIHILSHPSENIFIMNPSTEEEWRRILSFSGFDMLGETKGWEMHRPDKDPMFTGYSELERLPEKREIPFSRALRKALLAGRPSKLRRMLIESGFIFNSDIKESVDTIEGFYYQEKLRLILDAIQNNEMLYIERIGCEAEIIRPLELEKREDTAILSSDNGKYDVSRFWKTGKLPLYIRSQD